MQRQCSACDATEGNRANGGVFHDPPPIEQDEDDIDFVVSPTPPSPPPEVSRSSHHNDAPSHVPEVARPSHFPHRGFLFKSDEDLFNSDFAFSPFMYIHKVISKKDPLYHCEAANEARRHGWNKILEFNALDINKPIEKADLLRRRKPSFAPS